ncbi:unnamed protein product [Rhizophagus irregularis]|nr:unnamed protein product [Rhizophagus irregularis]
MTSTTLTSSSTLSQETSMSSFELTQEVLEAARDSLLEQETQIILAENISRATGVVKQVCKLVRDFYVTHVK